MTEEIFVPINRKKMIVKSILYSFIGLAGFLLLYYFGESKAGWIGTTLKIVSVVFLLFFLILIGTFAKNIKNKLAGLYINKTGIDDQSNSISLGLIQWKDIKSIQNSSKDKSVILVEVKNNKKYLDKAKNNAIKRVLEQNITLYKTPVVINVSQLLANSEELLQDLNAHYDTLRHR